MPYPFRFYPISAQTLLPSERKQEIHPVKSNLYKNRKEMCTSKLVEKILPPHNALSISLFPNLHQTLLPSERKQEIHPVKSNLYKNRTKCELTNTVKNPYLYNALFISLLHNLRPNFTSQPNESKKSIL